MIFFQLQSTSTYSASAMLVFVLILVNCCINFSSVDGNSVNIIDGRSVDEQEMETTFPTGTPIPGTDERLVNLKMLGAPPKKSRGYFKCTVFNLPSSEPFYIRQIAGNASNEDVHHVVLYGCDHFPKDKCVCPVANRTTFYAWSLNTPAVRMPKHTVNGKKVQTGIQIGGNPIAKYVFMQVHYRGPLKVPDTKTGLELRVSSTKPEGNSLVGSYTIMAIGTIQPKKAASVLDTCVAVETTSEMIPFTYQPHTHPLGRRVGLYYYDKPTGEVVELGHANPRFPQAYYVRKVPLTKLNAVPVKKQGRLLLRCVYDTSSLSAPISTSLFGGKEMCIMNFMYIWNGPGVPPKNPIISGACTADDESRFPPDSTTYLPKNKILDKHALYGNQTGKINIVPDGSLFMNLDLEDFSSLFN